MHRTATSRIFLFALIAFLQVVPVTAELSGDRLNLILNLTLTLPATLVALVTFYFKFCKPRMNRRKNLDDESGDGTFTVGEGAGEFQHAVGASQPIFATDASDLQNIGAPPSQRPQSSGGSEFFAMVRNAGYKNIEIGKNAKAFQYVVDAIQPTYIRKKDSTSAAGASSAAAAASSSTTANKPVDKNNKPEPPTQDS